MFRLLRFPGWRRVAASCRLRHRVDCERRVFVARPADWESWSHGAKMAVAGLAGGSYKLACCGWAGLLLWPLMERRDKIALVAGTGLAVATFGRGLTGVWCVASGCCYFLGNLDFGGRIIGVVWQVAGWPLLLGVLPLIVVETFEHLEVNAPLRRWLLGGRGHAASWIRKPELKRLCKALPRDAAAERFYWRWHVRRRDDI